MRTSKSGQIGDISRFKVTADGQDITAAVAGCHIWQDIFTPSWSCTIMMSDTNNVIHTIPLKQGTEIVITLETQVPSPTDGNKDFKFMLHKITDRVLVKSMHQTYAIHGVSKALLKNQGKRVSKYYKDKPESIAQQLVQKELGGQVETGSSEDQIEVIIPNWSPFVAANWLCKMATSQGAADFVFFMKDDDKYKMDSVEKMYGDSCGVKLVQSIAGERTKDGNIEDKALLSISQYHIEHYDGLSNLVGGYYASQLVWYDLVKKKWDKKDFKFGEDIGADGAKKAFTGSEFTDSKLANMSWVPKHDNIFKKGDDNIYKKAEKWSGTRKSSVMKLDQDRLFVQLPGGVKFWEYLGKSIEVDLASHEDMSGEKFDKYYRGTYLIVAINHTVQGDTYFVNLQLVKKRLEKGM